MSIRALWSRLRGSLDRDAIERDMIREMQFHLEMATSRNVRRGMSPEAAERQARIAFGSAEAFRESGREASLPRMAENVVSDVRFAFRSLRRSPAFTTAAVLTMTLGIGASTALFTVVNAVLLRPLPIPRPNDFTHIGWVWPKGGDIPALTGLQYEFVRGNARAFEAVATYDTREAFLGDNGAAQAIRGLGVAGDFVRTIGFPPRIGRSFSPDEMRLGAPVVILGDDVWRSRFAGDSGILGRHIRLAGKPHAVVGVLPPEFRFPPAPRHTGFLVPVVVDANPADEGHNTNAIGRFREGMSADERAAETRALTDAFRAAHPSLAQAGESFRLFTQTEVAVNSSQRQMLWVLFGAVSLVLVIAAANTATLLLVRASSRQREIAVRASIGASPRRILQQLSIEALVLSLGGAALGLACSIVAVRSFLAAAPNVLPAGTDPGIDARVLAYAVGVSVVTGIIFGLLAAAPAFRARLSSALLGGARGATPGNTRLREGLVLLEAAIAVVLLCGAAVLGTSFVRLIAVDPGFDTEHVVAVRLGLFPPHYDSQRREQLVDRLLQRARELPGVEHAAAAPSLPFERGRNIPVDIAGRPDLAIGAVEIRSVSPGYLGALGVPLRRGRDFDEGDVTATEPVAIVNEAFARHFWGEESPLDRSIQVGHYKDRWINPRLERQTRVIGVSADIRDLGLHRNPRPTVLLPRRAGDGGTSLLLVRGRAPELRGALRDVVAGAEPQLSPVIEPLSAVMDRSVAGPRFRMVLIGAFAGFAVLLTAVGIYGVIASVVQQRRREIGLRLALGANQAAVVTAVARRCLLTVAAGTMVGLAIFWVARRVLTSMLFEVSSGDPRVLALGVAILALVTLFASWIPARRAAHIDPASSLRVE